MSQTRLMLLAGPGMGWRNLKTLTTPYMMRENCV